jgi:2-methylcitrate dehydratase PrpD
MVSTLLSSSPPADDTPISRQLAAWVAQLHWDAIPAEIRGQVMPRVADTVGLAIAARDTPAVRAALEWQHLQGGHRSSSAVSVDDTRGPAAQVAMINAVAAHSRDFDDTLPVSVVHPGSVVVPVALALGEALESEPDAFGSAIVAGYEVAARIGAVAGRAFHARGLHATGIVGPIAAAVTASRIMGLDAERTSWAMGLASSMAGGLMSFLKDGGWSKWLHAGWAAQGGIVAAQLAERGFKGPEHVLDGGTDLYSAFLHGHPVDRSPLTHELGREWYGARARFKFYPCAHVIHPYVDGLLDIMRSHGLDAADVESVVCDIAPWAAAIVAEPREAKLRFTTELEAIASLPYQLALAALDKRLDLRSLDESYRNRPDVAAYAPRIQHRCDAALGHGFDGWIEVRTRSGAIRQTVELPQATPDRIVEKFVSNVATEATEPQIRTAAWKLLDSPLPDWRMAARLLADSTRLSRRAA